MNCPGSYRTTTVPVIDGWIEQRYAYEPAVLKVTWNVPLETLPLLPKVGEPVEVTVWVVGVVHVQVTIPPTAIVSTAMFWVAFALLRKKRSPTVTPAVSGAVDCPETVSSAESALVPALTTIWLVPFPAAVAVTAVPVRGLTVATLAFRETQVIGRFVPTLSCAVAVKPCVPSGVVIDAALGFIPKVDAKRRTTSARCAEMPDEVATMFVLPSDTAVASPVEVPTVATPGEELDQETVAPATVLLCESRGTALYCLVRVVVRSVSLPEVVSSTEATTCVTLIGTRCAVSVAADATAVSEAPTASAVASPVGLTLAVAPVPARAHATAAAPATGAPPESTTVPVSWRVEPIAPNATEVVETVIAFATCATVTVRGSETTPPEDAVICVVPFPVTVTSPVELTVATEVALESQVSDAPATAAPDASRAVALNCAVRPSVWKAAGVEADAISTDATATGPDPPSPPPPQESAAIVAAMDDDRRRMNGA